MDPIPVRLTPEVQERIAKLADKLSLSRSAVVRLAIQQWLDAADRNGINPLLREDHSKKRVSYLAEGDDPNG